MSSLENKGLFGSFKSDFPASIIVFLVALPLCLGIAAVSIPPEMGQKPFAGIIAGVIGGIVVAMISRSSLGVSGPAAGLAAIVVGAISELGSYEIFLMAVVLGGGIQIILSFLRGGVIGYYFPSSVISGMLTGIGIFITLKQIPDALGVPGEFTTMYGIKEFYNHSFSELASHVQASGVLIFLASMAVLVLWETKFMKKMGWTKLIQGPLVVVLLGIILYSILPSEGALSIETIRAVKLEKASNFTEFTALFTLPDFGAITNPKVWQTAFVIAVVASLETLLSVEATDKLDPYKRVTPTNRELLAQGVGNSFSGLVGGLPITQVIVRSSTNIISGGKTRLSAILHGILLFACVLLIPAVLNLIPYASLAAILVIVGYKLAKPSVFKKMYQKGKWMFIPFVATILVLVFKDLLWGVGIGMVIAITHILWKNYLTPYHFDSKDHVDGKTVTIQLAEVMSFLNKASITKTLNHVPDGVHLIIDATPCRIVHPDIIEVIEDFLDNAKSRDIEVTLKGKMIGDLVHPVKSFQKNVPNGEVEKKGIFNS